MNIYEYTDYHQYLNDYINSMPGKGRGIKSALAKKIGCQTTYVSHVLKNRADFGLEQADIINKYFGHTKEECHYFLLLVQFKRAGTASLKKHFRVLIEDQKKQRLILSKRLNVKKALSEKDQARYYSAWYYSAVHILITIEGLRTKNKIAKTLNLNTVKVSNILDFLISVGLAKQDGIEFIPGETYIHLSKNSDMISMHHTNWRMKAIQSLEHENEDSLHYSSVISLSEEDSFLIKEILIKSIDKSKKIIQNSTEQILCSFNLDFYKLSDPGNISVNSKSDIGF